MDCKKCGSPIKEGNSFCTNCGRDVNSEENIVTKKKTNIKPTYIIIVVILIAIISVLGIVISMKSPSESSNSNGVIETTGEQTESTESKIEVGVEYNSTTYGTLGYFKFENETIFSMCTGIANSEGIMVSGNYTIDGNKIKLIVTYDSTLIDPVEPTKQLDEPYEIEMTILSDGTIKYVNLAGYTEIFDKNAKAQEVDTSIVQENLLERIYAKYPELKGTEGIICTDGELYWLLDESGNKDYFYSFEEFDVKWQKYSVSTSNNSQSKDTTNNKQNIHTSNLVEKEHIDVPDLKGMTEKEAIAKVKSLNIPYEIKYKENLSYDEGVVIGQTEHTKFVTDKDGDVIAGYILKVLYPGETLTIIVNKYDNITMNVDVDIACLIRQYIEICNKRGINPVVDEYIFDFKINNKSIYSETVSKTKIENIIKSGSDYNNEENLISTNAISELTIHGPGVCGKLQPISYSGYGIFDIELTINNITVFKCDCNFYHGLDNGDFTKNTGDSLHSFMTYDSGKYSIWAFDHGGI